MTDTSPESATATLPLPALALALREATAEAHAGIEALALMLRLTSEGVTLADYRHYLCAMAEVYAPLEGALYAALDPVVRERLGVTPKLPALLADLREQGIEWRPDAACSAALAARSLDALVGGLYVLEGATLGGRTIARQLRRRLDPRALGGATFLDFHGEHTGPAWRAFCTALDALRVEGRLDQAALIEGALATFADIHQQLSTVEPVARH